MLALFPGQGSQHIGMGKDLFENFKSVQERFEEASDSIGVNIKKLCFDGPEADLTLTQNTQPCLLTVSVCAFETAQSEAGFQPSLVAGHSLGEYSALVAAGALPFATAVKWVYRRGQEMQSAVPAGEGSMAAIMGLEDEKAQALCREATEKAKSAPSQLSVETYVEPANFNAPGQIVIAGSKNAVEAAIDLAKTEAFSAKAIPLAVSAPFHSRLMAPAREKMAAFLKGEAQPNELKTAYIPNRTARITTESSVVADLLIEQIDHPVLWTCSMETAIKEGHEKGVEFGPGKVLGGLAKRISRESIKTIGKSLKVHSVGNTETLKKLGEF